MTVFRIINAEILRSISRAFESQKEDTQSSLPLNETLTLREASNTFDDSIAAATFASVGGLPAKHTVAEEKTTARTLIAGLHKLKKLTLKCFIYSAEPVFIKFRSSVKFNESSIKLSQSYKKCFVARQGGRWQCPMRQTVWSNRRKSALNAAARLQQKAQ
jgi:hypothetical protein